MKPIRPEPASQPMPRAAEPMVHGGPDALGVPVHDLSSNGNACGPCPQVLECLRRVDVRHYPDPAYTDLRWQLADWHGVAPERIVPGTSASELIQRLSLAVALQAAGQRPARVAWPRHAYGDYARAARAARLQATSEPAEADLVWACEPSSPHGRAEPQLAARVAALRPAQTLVLDQAYEPLRLEGAPSLDASQLQRVWRLITPNKALGMTGLRAAYTIAPDTVLPGFLLRVQQLAASWPLGVHGVALLQAWTEPEVQAWLAQSRQRLKQWKHMQVEALQRRGWQVQPGQASFFVAGLPEPVSPAALAAWLARLRQHGIKLRELASFGLPGQLRLSVAAPASQAALWAALDALQEERA